MPTESLFNVQQDAPVAPPLPKHIVVQVPPLGVFDRSDLQWAERPLTSGSNKGATVQEACIPFDRLDDFVTGKKEHAYGFQHSPELRPDSTTCCRAVHRGQNYLLSAKGPTAQATRQPKKSSGQLFFNTRLLPLQLWPRRPYCLVARCPYTAAASKGQQSQ